MGEWVWLEWVVCNGCGLADVMGCGCGLNDGCDVIEECMSLCW